MNETLTRSQIENQIMDCIVEACELEPEKVLLPRQLVNELGIDSIDLVDLIYHLEKRFGITIKMGDFEKEARRLSQGPFEKNSVITLAGRDSLRQMMPEIDPEKIQEGLTLSEIPLLFTVASLVGMVERKLKVK